MSDNTYSSGKDFSQDLIIANLMGPNVVSIFNELCAGKLPAGDDAQICDLGCGAGLSSLAIAAACEGRIHAIDSWNTPSRTASVSTALPSETASSQFRRTLPYCLMMRDISIR